MFPFSIVKPRKKSAWKIVTEVEIIYKACLSITCIAYKIHNQKFYFLFMKHFFILDQQDSTWGSHSLCWPNSLNIMSLNKTVVVVWDSQGILMTKNCLSWMFAFVQGSYFPCFEAWGCMRTYIFVWHSSFSAMSFFSLFLFHLRLCHWLHSHRVSFRAEREMYFSVAQNLLLLETEVVLKGTKMKHSGLHWKCLQKKKSTWFFSFHYRFITLGYSSSLPNRDH